MIYYIQKVKENTYKPERQQAMKDKITHFTGAIVGNLFTERALALWIFMGRFEFALLWALAKMYQNKFSNKKVIKIA